MRNIPPIPKELLPHTIEYHEYDGSSRYGEDWKEPITIEHVRVEPNRSKQNSVPDEEMVSVIGCNIFYDCVNSYPQEINFIPKSKIVWNGREMYLDSYDDMYGFAPTPHHKVLSVT